MEICLMVVPLLSDLRIVTVGIGKPLFTKMYINWEMMIICQCYVQYLFLLPPSDQNNQLLQVLTINCSYQFNPWLCPWTQLQCCSWQIKLRLLVTFSRPLRSSQKLGYLSLSWHQKPQYGGLGLLPQLETFLRYSDLQQHKERRLRRLQIWTGFLVILVYYSQPHFNYYAVTSTLYSMIKLAATSTVHTAGAKTTCICCIRSISHYLCLCFCQRWSHCHILKTCII